MVRVTGEAALNICDRCGDDASCEIHVPSGLIVLCAFCQLAWWGMFNSRESEG